jgi:protein-tyrosine-phosphatase
VAKHTVLFICVANAGRSLMAEAIFNESPPSGWAATSAGTMPASAPSPRTAEVLREIGLEVPPHPPRLLTQELMETADVRITMGCLDSDSCPARLKTLELRDWALPDPAKLDGAGIRAVRDELRSRIKALKEELAMRDRRRRTVDPS